MKEHKLCLDQCKIHPKLILNDGLKTQHENHDCQLIEKIINRINEPPNHKIIKEFLMECDISSMLAENEDRRQKILKKLELDVNRIFDDIAKLLLNIYFQDNN